MALPTDIYKTQSIFKSELGLRCYTCGERIVTKNFYLADISYSTLKTLLGKAISINLTTIWKCPCGITNLYKDCTGIRETVQPPRLEDLCMFRICKLIKETPEKYPPFGKLLGTSASKMPDILNVLPIELYEAMQRQLNSIPFCYHCDSLNPKTKPDGRYNTCRGCYQIYCNTGECDNGVCFSKPKCEKCDPSAIRWSKKRQMAFEAWRLTLSFSDE